jgi:hypothetical protein
MSEQERRHEAELQEAMEQMQQLQAFVVQLQDDTSSTARRVRPASSRHSKQEVGQMSRQAIEAMQQELEQLRLSKQRDEELAARRAQASVETVASQQELAAKGEKLSAVNAPPHPRWSPNVDDSPNPHPVRWGGAGTRVGPGARVELMCLASR